jgi:hypothetical protein
MSVRVYFVSLRVDTIPAFWLRDPMSDKMSYYPRLNSQQPGNCHSTKLYQKVSASQLIDQNRFY